VPLILLLLFLGGCGSASSFIKPAVAEEDNLTSSTVSIVVEDSVKTIIKPTDKPVPTVDIIKEISFEPNLSDDLTEKPNIVRILLEQKRKSIAIISYSNLRALSSSKNIRIGAGTLQVSAVENGMKISAHGKSAEVSSPCTLTVTGGNSIWGFEKSDYRGKLILSLTPKKNIRIINSLPVEDYLRGVVPLEIGRKSIKDMAAMKVQAVAARTYTYSRMSARVDLDYDLLPTVSDQVYGGASAEYSLSDSAILATKDLVVTYKNSLIEAYYHSTCGGATAAVHKVWNTDPRPYLVSRSDLRPDGTAWCGISPLVSWSESWSLGEFNKIIRTESSKNRAFTPFIGNVISLSVTEKSLSGRVLNCKITSSDGVYSYGTDKIRFLMRTSKKGTILKSSKFDIKISNNQVIATGSGYGHGIGMCQMGAIGRARGGQNFEDILKSYYKNVDIELIGNINEYKQVAVN
jgi:stage II sporulation protein D